MRVVGLAVGLGQLSTEVGAHVAHDLVALVQVSGGAYGVDTSSRQSSAVGETFPSSLVLQQRLVTDAKETAECGWLAEKCHRWGRELVLIDRWVPTSKTCSTCGAVTEAAPLSMRTFECAACGLVLDRDTNAARTILAAGRAERRNACGTDIRPTVRAVGGGAGTHRDRAAA